MLETPKALSITGKNIKDTWTISRLLYNKIPQRLHAKLLYSYIEYVSTEIIYFKERI